MAVVLNLEDSKALLALCRSGKLYEIEDWIKSGKALAVDPAVRKSPLEVAIETGFHSLIVLLARNEPSPEAKKRALAQAVERRKRDWVQLLIHQGADFRAIPFIDVLRTWDRDLIGFFLHLGADPLSDQPFTVAFVERIRVALRVFKECAEALPEVAPALKAQAEKALRFFSREGNSKWVNLMLWVGADPRERGPQIDAVDENDPECDSSAMEEACISGKLDIVRKFKPGIETDDLSVLLRNAAHFGHAEVVRYLLRVGAVVNDKANGGSTALDHCLWHLEFEDSNHIRFRTMISRYGVRRTLDTLQALLESRALWRPDDRRAILRFRRTLLGCEPLLVLEILKMLKAQGAVTTETAREIVDAPKMQKHLAGNTWHLQRLGGVERPSSKPSYVSYRLLSRFNRQKLYEEVWSEPMWKLAPRYGVSDVALAKTCRKLKIPRPARGHWAKVAAGKVGSKQPPLPAFPVTGEK